MARKKSLEMITLGFLCGFALMACRTEVNSNIAGVIDAAIIGGTDVTESAPLSRSVALLFNRLTTEVCTVSILNNQFALTAGHCISGHDTKNLYLVFDTTLSERSTTRRVVAAKPSDYYNPHANRKTNTSDIAVIRFEGGVPQGYTAASFLPNPTLLTNRAEVTVVGYGVNDEETRTGAGVLRTTNVQILDSNYSQTELTIDQSQKSGVCHGDSGGPVYKQVNGKHYLWGVVSRSVNPDNCSEAAIITDSLMYLSWIREVVLSMGREKMEIPPDDGPLLSEAF